MRLARRLPSRPCSCVGSLVGDYSSEFTIRTSWYSVGLRPGNVDMLHWVNTFIFIHLQNDDLEKIYQKWVGSKLPPVPTM